MRAITYQDIGALSVTEVPEPTIRLPHEVLVDVEMTGICGTDHKIIAGKLDVAAPGAVLGHEGVGTVREIGSAVTTLTPGDRVAINPTQSCLTCMPCRSGKFCYCENFDVHQVGFTLPGTFAEQIVVSERWLYAIPDDMSWQVASLIEPLGCSLNTILKSRVQLYESVLIIGGGPIGALCAGIAQGAAAVTVVSEPSEFRRNLVATFVDHSVDPAELTPQRVRTLTGNAGFDVVVDAVGNQLTTALSHANKGGRVVAMGYDDKYVADVPPTTLIDRGINIVAEVSLHDPIAAAVRLASTTPHLKNLVTVEVEMADYLHAFEETMGYRFADGSRFQPQAMKAVIHS